MAINLINKYQKTGGIFTDATEAYNDKNSKFSPELLDVITQWEKDKLADGVMLAPTEIAWDPATYMLTISRKVTSASELNDTRPFNGLEVLELAEEAGWMFVSQDELPL